MLIGYSQPYGHMVHRWKQEEWLQDDICYKKREDPQVFGLGMILSTMVQLS